MNVLANHFSVPPDLATAIQVACYISGGDARARSAAVETGGDRILALTTEAGLKQTLATQIIVLESIFLSFAKSAMTAKGASEKVKLIRASLDAQDRCRKLAVLLQRREVMPDADAW